SPPKDSIPLPQIKDRDGPSLTPADPATKTSEAREPASKIQTVRSFFSWPQFGRDKTGDDKSDARQSAPTPRMTNQELPPGPPQNLPPATQPSGQETVTQVPFPGMFEQRPDDKEAGFKRFLAQQMLRDGFKALDLNDLEKAKMFALKAKEVRPNFAFNEP